MKIEQMWKQLGAMTPIFYDFEEYEIRIVKSKTTGTRIVLNSSLVDAFAGCKGVYISMHPDSGYIVFTKKPEGKYYELNGSGITIENEKLIEEIIKTFNLDFSNRTSQSFVLHLKVYGDVDMFFAKMKEVK